MSRDFLTSSSMHGLKYIGEHNRNWVERIMWSFIFILAVGTSIFLSLGMWNKYDSSPLMISIETADEPLRYFEFPSVTICSQTRLSKSKLKRVLEQNTKLQSLTTENIKLAMQVLMKPEIALNRSRELILLNNIFVESGVSTDELINVTLEAMVTCEDIFLECRWKNQMNLCSDLFVMRPTDEGLCCGFNHLETEWKFRAEKFDYNEIFKVDMVGHSVGLTVVLGINLEDFTASSGYSKGFKVLVHNPREYPEVGQRGFSISPGFEIFSGLGPIASYNTPSVDKLAVHKRQCCSNSDEILKFYGNYSASKCSLECLTRRMLDQCGCRPFYYNARNSDPICDLKSHVCLAEIMDDFQLNSSKHQFCNCHPLCLDIWYSNELSLGAFPSEDFLSTPMADRIIEKQKVPRSQLKNYLSENVAVLNIFYRDSAGYVYQTDIRYGIEDFISSMAGLLGLGFGFSFISLIEILYFFGVRKCFSSKKNKTCPTPYKTNKNLTSPRKWNHWNNKIYINNLFKQRRHMNKMKIRTISDF